MTENDDYPSNVAMLLHWVDNETGIKMIFRNDQVQNMTVPLDQLFGYVSDQDDNQARLLQTSQAPTYSSSTDPFTVQDIYDIFKDQLVNELQDIFGNNTNIQVEDI